MEETPNRDLTEPVTTENGGATGGGAGDAGTSGDSPNVGDGASREPKEEEPAEKI